MRLIVDGPQPFLAHVGVQLRGGQVGMAQQLLHRSQVGPAVEKLATDLAGRVKVVKINTDEQPELGERFGVRSIPTLILFERGREKDRVIGARPAPALRSWVDSKLTPAA